jgi:hypothetical protein
MFDLNNNIQDILIRGVEKNDIIEYQNDNVQSSIFVVFDTSVDNEIPALLLQLWKFEGGYDHAFVNVMEVDFGLNKRVKHFIPMKKNYTVDNILSYRGVDTDLSEKEQFFFDLWPKSTSEVKTEEYHFPFKISVKENDNKTLILPTWTPLQRIPLDKVKSGTVLETWSVNNITTVMRVLNV